MPHSLPWLLLLGFFASTYADQSAACTFMIEDVRFVQHEAPVGGAWWLLEGFADDELTEIELGRADAPGSLVASVLGRRLSGAPIVEVPADARPGDRFFLPPEFAPSWSPDSADFLSVTDGPADDDEGAIPRPDVRIEVRSTRTGYSGIATVPFGDMCSQEAGLWTHEYRQRPYAVGNVPDRFVLDLVVRPGDEPPFQDFAAANPIVFDGRHPGSFDELLPVPLEVTTELLLHARYRRISDGRTGETVTLPVEVDPTVEERVEWVGCSAASPTSILPLVLLLGATWRRRSVLRQGLPR